jgi:uncharacterized membrane protein YphA (DoxX/SURF4 family)
MKKTTAFFLVALRLALGWAILVEGLEKVNKPDWSSEPYLRESTGPLASYFRDIPGDAVVERLSLVSTQDPGRTAPHMRLPPALARDWHAYLDRFTEYYELTPEQRQSAATKLQQREDQTVGWIQRGKIKIAKTFPNAPPVDVEKTPQEWLEEYAALRKKSDEVLNKEMGSFGRAADPKFATARAEAAKVRSELASGLKQQNDDMQKALPTVLTPEQAKKEPLAYPIKPGWHFWDWSLLNWSDNIVKWGLVVVGVCLIAGLFTRTACVVGALLLLSFFLAMPPLPGAPLNPKAEGTYFFINKTFIMALALLALATTPSGRWLGLDGLVQFLNPRRWRTAQPQPERYDVPRDLGPATPRPDLALPEVLPVHSAPLDNGSDTASVSAQAPKDSTDGS